MKNSNYLIIILAAALVAVSYKWITSSNSTENSNVPNAADAAIENIMSRTSVRT